MENNKIFCFNLKLKAENLIACTSKEDLIELIRQSEESFEFATRKDAMDGMNVSSTKLARGIKDGKILIGNIEYKFERK